MVGLTLLQTLIVGAAMAAIAWKYQPPAWTPAQSIGLFLMITGFILWSTARFQLGRSFSVTPQAKQLVTGGLYSRFRNPIYLFGSCSIAGLMLFTGRVLGLLTFLIVIPMQLWRSRKEAQVLEAKFGDDYRAYRAKTWF